MIKSDLNITNKKQVTCVACREPIQIEATVCPHCQSVQSRSTWRFLTDMLKWVGGAAAVISLVAGALQLNSVLQNARERSQAVADLIRAADIQIEADDLENAMPLIQEALQLESSSSAAREKQVTVAMMLTRQTYNLHQQEDRELLESLMPVLYRGAGDPDPERAAEVLAHIAWANHLRSRQSGSQLPVQDYFSRAFDMDSGNVFAHILRGNWCLRANEPLECGDILETATHHYETALKSERYREYVIEERFYSLYLGGEKANILLLKMMVELKRSGQDLAPELKSRILDKFEYFYGVTDSDEEKLHRLLQEVTPDDALALLRWVSEDLTLNRDYWKLKALRADLTILVGNTTDALSQYKQLRLEIRHEELTKRQFYFSRWREKIDHILAGLLEIQPGWLGVEIQGVSTELAEALGRASLAGILVGEVMKGSAGEQGGIRSGDILHEIDGRVIGNSSRLRALGSALAGDVLDVVIYRDKTLHTLQVRLGEQLHPTERIALDDVRGTTRLAIILDDALYQPTEVAESEYQLRVVDLNSEFRRIFEIQQDINGALVFDAYSRDWEADLQAGDIIVEVGRAPVSDVATLMNALAEARALGKSSILLSRLRGTARTTVVLTLDNQ